MFTANMIKTKGSNLSPSHPLAHFMPILAVHAPVASTKDTSGFEARIAVISFARKSIKN